jgi:NitT/TauT family transport system substrate-binding protein
MSHMYRTALAIAALAAAGLSAPASAQEKSISIGLPGIPPVFVTTQAYVAEQQGFFKKHGLKVNLRPFDSGAAAARAVQSGQIELSMSPSPLIATMISNNPDVDLALIYGYPRPTWKLGSLDGSITKCEDVKGKAVGVDSLGGARSIALNQMLRSCKLSSADTNQVALSANVGAAMVAGQIPLGVLHVDELPAIEREAKKKVGIVVDINQTQPVNHYLALVAKKKSIAENRDTLVKVIAAFIEAERFLRDPKNVDAAAKAAAPTGRSIDDAKAAIPDYVKIGFWPQDNPGLAKENLDAIIGAQQRAGNIKGTPTTVERLADTSLYEAALKLAK